LYETVDLDVAEFILLNLCVNQGITQVTHYNLNMGVIEVEIND